MKTPHSDPRSGRRAGTRQGRGGAAWPVSSGKMEAKRKCALRMRTGTWLAKARGPRGMAHSRDF